MCASHNGHVPRTSDNHSLAIDPEIATRLTCPHLREAYYKDTNVPRPAWRTANAQCQIHLQQGIFHINDCRDVVAASHRPLRAGDYDKCSSSCWPDAGNDLPQGVAGGVETSSSSLFRLREFALCWESQMSIYLAVELGIQIYPQT
ncbi:hypothetical protein J6590_066165 [Homalodisca vitripennis]|nr:hypothetical protein J6590_066165 [Homalodisca vitripennis]